MDCYSRFIADFHRFGPKREMLPVLPPPFAWKYNVQTCTYSLWHGSELIVILSTVNMFSKKDIYWHVKYRIHRHVSENGLLCSQA